MNLPPLILDLRVARSHRRPIHLWLPLFLLWPLAFVLGALALLVALVTDAALLAAGRRYHHYTVLLVRSFEALSEARGTVIHIDNERAAVHVTVQ